MEQLKGIDVVLDVDHRTIELQCVVNYIVQSIRVYIFAKESAGYGVGYLLETHLLDVVEKLLWQLVDTLGHIQSAIFCQSLNYCFVQIGNRGLIIRTIVLHTYVI